VVATATARQSCCHAKILCVLLTQPMAPDPSQLPRGRPWIGAVATATPTAATLTTATSEVIALHTSNMKRQQFSIFRYPNLKVFLFILKANNVFLFKSNLVCIFFFAPYIILFH